MSEKLQSFLFYMAGILMVGGVIVMFCDLAPIGMPIAGLGIATGLFRIRIEADKNFARICYAIVCGSVAIEVFVYYPNVVRGVAAFTMIAGIWGLIFAAKK